ncbi:GPO family capsid scaffolding protein [Endozoicomonas ascidiicola]|uniref:GPO family capsid scaffolding protein n=1 Tax=Endozoicomonas ascidiicola TaxID=1698521 RepID=UPI000835F971|nr:GPO family capsid scaffolding protein [Endozoicomonas ascidiicola]
MAKLVTDWVKVAESGKTIDGRVIEAAWLRDAAEQYSKEKYTAVITLEHYPPEYAGNYGTIEALKAEEADEVVSLYAKLCPSDNLRYMNKQGQKLFTSIKLHPDFQGTGRCYVIQIGVTDTPASIGTQQLEFRAQPGEQIMPGVELSAFNSVPDEQSLLEKIKALVFSAPTEVDSEDEDEPMKPEELKALQDSITKGFSALAEQLKPAEAPAAEPEAPAAEEAPAPETVSAEQFAALQTELADIKTQFTALTEKLSQEVPPTEVENTGPSGNSDKLGF